MFVEEDYPSPSAALVISVEDAFKQKPTPIPLRLPIAPRIVYVKEREDRSGIIALGLLGLFGLLAFLAYLASRRRT